MAKIKNNGAITPIAIGFVHIAPGETVEVADWDRLKALPVIRHYLDSKVLEVVPASKAKDESK